MNCANNARMYHQTCGLVDNHQHFVLVHYIKGYVFRLYRRFVVRTVEHQCDNVAWVNLVVASDWRPVDMDETSFSSLLDAAPGSMLDVLQHIFVDAYRLLSTINFHAQVFVKLYVIQFIQHIGNMSIGCRGYGDFLKIIGLSILGIGIGGR